MRVYNLEIFSPTFVLKDHATVVLEKFTDDYLAPEETIVEAPAGIAVAVGDYIRLTDRICGVVSSLEREEKWETKIAFKPFSSLLDIDVMFDTRWQRQGTLENRLAQLIRDYLINNADTQQNVPGLSVTTTTSTTNWGFNLKALVADTNKLIIGLYETLLTRSLEEYEVAVDVKVDFMLGTIAVTIGRVDIAPPVIEADLQNVIYANIALDEREFDVNKIVLYNSENLTENYTFYMHPDGTYDTQNRDRLYPVRYRIDTAFAEEGEAFIDAARTRAGEIFGIEKVNNLIEIDVMPDDHLVPVENYLLGQDVVVMSAGKRYNSIVTGFVFGETHRLILGAVRLDLTKQVKGRRNGRTY